MWLYKVPIRLFTLAAYYHILWHVAIIIDTIIYQAMYNNSYQALFFSDNSCN